MPENTKSPSEPSMEDIIASISRIITEDKQPKEPPGPITGDTADVFELTDAISEDGSVRRLAPFNQSSPPTSASAAERGLSSPEAAPSETQPKATDDNLPPRLEPARERILSSATSGAAAAAFAQLSALPRERRKEGDLSLGAADRTLEEIVRDLLRPLLQSWLDEHLPGIVERLVREEIARVVGEAGLR